MSVSPLEPSPAAAPGSFRIQGGHGAPGRARDRVLSHLDLVDGTGAGDVILIVSELVTNSVRHANVDTDQTLSLELTRFDGHLRIAVTDSGSPLQPRLLRSDSPRPGGLGLRLVEQLSSAWRVERDAAGTTRVWCDVPVDQGPAG